MSAGTTTGDIQNNISKLRKELALVGYRPPSSAAYCRSPDNYLASSEDAERDFLEGLLRGSSRAIIPILRHALLEYSRPLASHLLERDLYDVYAKSDARFLEAVWRVCRDEFDYRPTIKREQLLSKVGKYVERKIIFATDFVAECRKKHAELVRLGRLGNTAELRRHAEPGRRPAKARPPSRGTFSAKYVEKERTPVTPFCSRTIAALGYRGDVLKEKQEPAASRRRQQPIVCRSEFAVESSGVVRDRPCDVKDYGNRASGMRNRNSTGQKPSAMEEGSEQEDVIRTIDIAPTAHPAALLQRSFQRRQFPANDPPSVDGRDEHDEEIHTATGNGCAEVMEDIVDAYQDKARPPMSGDWQRNFCEKQSGSAADRPSMTGPLAGSRPSSTSPDGPTLWSYLTQRRSSDMSEVRSPATLVDILEDVEANLMNFSRQLRNMYSQLLSVTARVTAVENELAEKRTENRLSVDVQTSRQGSLHQAARPEVYQTEACEDGRNHNVETTTCEREDSGPSEALRGNGRLNRWEAVERPGSAPAGSAGQLRKTPTTNESPTPQPTDVARWTPSPCQPNDSVPAQEGGRSAESEKAGKLIQNISERFRVTRQLLERS